MDLKINSLPAFTFGWLKMNETELADIQAGASIQPEIEIPEDITISEEKIIGLEHVPTGGGKGVDFLVKSSGIARKIFRLGKGQEAAEPIRMSFPMKAEKKTSINPYGFEVEEDSKITVIMDFSSEEETSGSAAVQSKIHLEKNAQMTLVQIFRLGEEYRLINDIGAYCEENASFNVIHIVLSGKEIYQGCKATLAGDGSQMHANIGYEVKKDHILDMNYVADQLGKKTVSEMKVSGVLRDQARKLFRGTIDFKNGCAGSTGDEVEDVLLIDEDVVNQTIPLILCAEEDVFGNHGATIGRIDEEIQFYMQSRGIEAEAIYDIMAKARIDSVISMIPDEETIAKLSD
jgi:Fe-S cluster assembly scaffold protein SufB